MMMVMIVVLKVMVMMVVMPRKMKLHFLRSHPVLYPHHF